MLKFIYADKFRLNCLCLSVLLMLLACNVIDAQTKKHLGNSLPLDTAVHTGVLKNGFTYYIRKNQEPKGRILFYLANKVGSIQEDQEQLGLAHFMEHMNFNGTIHYPKNELVNYLQKIGVRFGADLNASTSFEETVYQLPIPSDKPELIKNGLLIMHDWAQGATLNETAIKSERGVILEEKRMRNTVGLRMVMQEMPVVLNNSKYADRWPIGTEEVLNTFKPEVLKRFYRDWYRPNLQALIVVGDCNPDSLERVIKSQFSDLKNPEKIRARITYPTKLDGSNKFVLITDKEASGTEIDVINKQPELAIRSLADYKQSIIRNFFNQMMSERFAELAHQSNPAFVNAGSYIGGYITGHISVYNSQVILKPNEYEAGFKALWRENERVKRFGFTISELNRAKKQYLNNMAVLLSEKDKTSSSKYVNEYVRLFLNGEASPGIDKEYRMAKDLTEQITVNDLNILAKKIISDHNRDIIIKSSEAEKNHVPYQKTFISWIKAVDMERIKPFADEVIDKPILAKAPVPGKIISENTIPSLGITQLKLSNGIKVFLKPTDYKNDQIVFNSFAPGGTNQYSEADFESADNAVNLIAGSGAGSFTSTQLNKLISGDQIGVNPYMDELYKGLRGSATPKSLEKCLQIAYLYFTQPRKDSANFNNFKTRFSASIVGRDNNPQTVFNDTIVSVFHGYNPRFSPPSKEKINSIDLDKAYNVYKEQFSNTGNFTFIIVGSFTITEIKPLIEKYLASLPSSHQSDNVIDLGIHPVPGKITKKVYAGDLETANVSLVFNGKYDFNADNNIQIDALGEIVKFKMIERLRQTESGIYSPSLAVNRNKLPHPDYSIFISFQCAPNNVDKLVNAALDEINKIKINGASLTDVQKYQEEARRSNELNLKNNYYWFSYLTKSIKTNGNTEDILNFNEALKSVTPESIKKAANTFLNEDQLLKFILLPEKYKL